MLHELALAVHVASGALALALGPLALYAGRRAGPAHRLAESYHWAVLAVSISAVLLAALDWSRLWWFVPIATASYALALLGRLAGKRGGVRWRGIHVRGQGGSYIALVTALLVVSVGSPLAWVMPTAIGAPLISKVAHRAQARATARPASPSLRDAAVES